MNKSHTSKDEKVFRINKKNYTANKRRNDDVIIGDICAAKRQPKKTTKIDFAFDDIPVTEKNGCGFWWKDTGYDLVIDDGHIRVMKRKVWPIIIFFLSAFFLFFLIYFLLTGQNMPRNAIDYIGDQTGIIESNGDVNGKIAGYTSFESVPDQEWDSSSDTQPILLKNMVNNPVDLCPSVYVDMDKDGAYEDDEMVWTSGDNEQRRIAPGNEIDTIKPDRKLEKGNYNAQVVYAAYMHGTDTPANGMNFAFKVTVK